LQENPNTVYAIRFAHQALRDKLHLNAIKITTKANSMNYPLLNSLLFNLVCLTTVLFLVCLFLSYINDSRIKKVDAQNAMAKAYLDGLLATKHDMLTNGKGKDGERRLAQVVVKLLNHIGVDFKTNQDVGIPDAILLPRGNDPYSKEIDLLLVTEFGVYVIEAKDWGGHLSTANDGNGKLVISYPSGKTELRDAPLQKTNGKLKVIQKAIPQEINCHALVVCTDENGTLDPNFGSNYMTLQELPYFLRTERDNRFSVSNLESLQAQVFGQLDKSPNALHDHMMRLSPTTDNIKKYQENHHAVVAAQARPQIKYQEEIKTQVWIVAFFVSLAVSGLTYAYAPKPSPAVINQPTSQKIEKVMPKAKAATDKKQKSHRVNTAN
jgi:hypothetical protein